MRVVKRRAPRTDGPLTHFASPRGEKSGLIAEETRSTSHLLGLIGRRPETKHQLTLERAKATISIEDAPVAQLDRVLASGARGRAFESRRAYQRFSHVHGLPDRRKDRAIQEWGRPQYPSDNHRQRLRPDGPNRDELPLECPQRPRRGRPLAGKRPQKPGPRAQRSSPEAGQTGDRAMIETLLMKQLSTSAAPAGASNIS